MVLRKIRLDNAPEFSLLDFYGDHAIIHQKSYAYTPQQNYVVERERERGNEREL